VSRVREEARPEDGLAASLRAGIGGPLGRHAGPTLSWWNPARVVLLAATVTYLLGMAWRLPCRITVAGEAPDWFKLMCYSDIGLLYEDRGLLQGNTPYLDAGDYATLEYPVFTGWFLELERLITGALGGLSGSDLTDQQRVDSTLLFFDVNQVLLGGLFLLAVWAQIRTLPGRPWDGLMLAASPSVAAAALINWDLLPVALTAVACLLWARRRPGWAGLLLGLGIAAKLYPGLLLGPLLLLCLRSGRMPAYGRLLATTALSWTAVNLPVLVLAPQAWRYFWSFNSARDGDLGSIWYVLSLAGFEVPRLNLISGGLFAVACVAIAGLIVLAPRRPRFGAVAFLVVVAFLMTNKVYSPQYVLWLLPLLILARPVWRDWLVFTVGELAYFGAIWWHLGGFLAPGDGSADRVYWLAVVVRLVAEGWVAAMVIRDLWRPQHDPLRAGGADDPAGGVLDRAPDARWVAPLRGRLGQRPHPLRRTS
jgi:uncharacterized membrane protein